MNSIQKNFPHGLNAILYSLYYILDIRDENEYLKVEKELRSNYTKEILNTYFEAVSWALDHSDIDLTKRLPNMNRNNDEILLFLTKVSIILKNILNE